MVNAADVLADKVALRRGQGDEAVAALLAHGEQGVAILKDGTLWTLEYAHTIKPGDPDHYEGDPSGLGDFYRLVPLSAEAGDTDES